tara:strand:- start:707 stop:868 length:162 start_codon:yes stop_codon:yes gene_type:complete
MDINKNIDLLQNFFMNMRFNKLQRLEAANIARVSKDLDELQENLNWEYQYKKH